MVGDVAVLRQRWLPVPLLLLSLLAACAVPPQEDADATDASATAAALENAMEDIWNNKNMAAIADLYAPDVASYTNGVRDTLSAQAFIEATLQQYPDARVDVVESVAAGDRVFLHWTWTATAVPSTTQSTVHGATIARVVDGKIVESHDFYDLLAFTLATGATITPPPGAVPPTTTTAQ